MYDLIIKNGLTIDFETMETAVKDIYVKNGLIAEGDGTEDAEFVTDAAGKYVLPGLIDEHVHLNVSNSNIGANADLLCIPMGVTTAVDAGTCGWTNFEGFYNYNIVRYVPDVKAYLHVSPYREIQGHDSWPEGAYVQGYAGRQRYGPAEAHRGAGQCD